jgi:hypothetical protein
MAIEGVCICVTNMEGAGCELLMLEYGLGYRAFLEIALQTHRTMTRQRLRVLLEDL